MSSQTGKVRHKTLIGNTYEDICSKISDYLDTGEWEITTRPYETSQGFFQTIIIMK